VKTSSTKPEVHACRIATPSENGAAATGNVHKNLVKFGRVVSNYASRQTERKTDRQTYMLNTILFTPPGSVVTRYRAAKQYAPLMAVGRGHTVQTPSEWDTPNDRLYAVRACDAVQ